jgi:hypothetical protein
MTPFNTSSRPLRCSSKYGSPKLRSSGAAVTHAVLLGTQAAACFEVLSRAML